MPLFIGPILTFIAGLFGSLVAWLAQFITKRMALVGAAIAIMVTLTAALWLALHSLVAGLAVAMPEEVSIAMGWFVPGNLESAISAILSGHLLRFTYDMKMRGVQMRLL